MCVSPNVSSQVWQQEKPGDLSVCELTRLAGTQGQGGPLTRDQRLRPGAMPGDRQTQPMDLGEEAPWPSLGGAQSAPVSCCSRPPSTDVLACLNPGSNSPLPRLLPPSSYRSWRAFKTLKSNHHNPLLSCFVCASGAFLYLGNRNHTPFRTESAFFKNQPH